MAGTVVTYTVAVDDGTITVDCSHCGRLVTEPADDPGSLRSRGMLSAHGRLHLTQALQLGVLMSTTETTAFLGRPEQPWGATG